MPQIVFENPKDGKINVMKAFEEAGIGNYTMSDLIYIDQFVYSDQLELLAQKGLVPLKLHHYKISPEPQPNQRGSLVEAFNAVPVTTELRNDGIVVGFREALEEKQLKAVGDLKFAIRPV